MVPSISAQDELVENSEKMMLSTKEQIEVDDKELEELEHQLQAIKVCRKKIQERRDELQKQLGVHNRRTAAVNKVRMKKVEKCLEGMESYNCADLKKKAISELEIELMYLKNNGNLFSEDPAIVQKK